MMNPKTSLLLISILFLLSNCIAPKEDQSHPSVQSINSAMEYEPALFVDDNRFDKIKSVELKLSKIMHQHQDKLHIPGISYGIVVDDSLVIASSLGLMDIEEEKQAKTTSAFRIASMTKSFTAMAILKLRDEGKLSLEDPVSKFIPEMKELNYLTTDAAAIDVENLLTMTAGFPEDNPWGDRQLDESDEVLLRLIMEGLSFSNAPSFTFEYSNTGYAMLGYIVSKISGIPFEDYISHEILEPLGMDNTYWEYDNVPAGELVKGYRWEDDQWKAEPMLHHGIYGAMGGLITSIEDFSKYVSFHLSAWPPRNDPDDGPLQRSSLREMQRPQFMTLAADANSYNGDPCPVINGYGFGLGQTEYCNGLKRTGHGGALPGFGSDYRFFPEYGIGIMAFCNLTYTSAYPRNEIMTLLFDSLDLQKRQLPTSKILKVRKDQIVELITQWNPDLESRILAENFYMDRSRAHRKAEIDELLLRAGRFQETKALKPLNQLRGSFDIDSENGALTIFFTLSPESDPKIQRLDISFNSGSEN